MQIKIIMRYHYISTRNAIITGQIILSIGEDVKNLEPLLISGSYSETATLDKTLVGRFSKS